MIIQHGKKFHVIGVEKNFWSVSQCNSLINAYQDKFIPYSFDKLGTHGAAEQPRNYPATSNRAVVHSKQVPSDIHELVKEYNRNSYNFVLQDETVQYINKLTPAEDLGWHKDNLEEIETLYTKRAPYRISVVIKLNNKFTGGATEIYKHDPFNLNTGDALLFCCDMWHRSTPVTAGTKYSFNMWTRGVPIQ